MGKDYAADLLDAGRFEPVLFKPSRNFRGFDPAVRTAELFRRSRGECHERMKRLRRCSSQCMGLEEELRESAFRLLVSQTKREPPVQEVSVKSNIEQVRGHCAGRSLGIVLSRGIFEGRRPNLKIVVLDLSSKLLYLKVVEAFESDFPLQRLLQGSQPAAIADAVVL
jgi:hypothetical protein